MTLFDASFKRSCVEHNFGNEDSEIDLFVLISPDCALFYASRVDGTGCLGRWFYIPRTILNK